MLIRRRVAIAALLLCVSACGADESPTGPSDQPGGPPRMQGRLTDFASGGPMGGVSLAFGLDVTALDRRTTTDGRGAFSVEVPAGRVYAAIDRDIVAELTVPARGVAHRGDLLGNGGDCISRYGVISEAVTFHPVAGATVMYVTHPAYRQFQRVLGRGIHRVHRIDAELQRP